MCQWFTEKLVVMLWQTGNSTDMIPSVFQYWFALKGNIYIYINNKQHKVLINKNDNNKL